MNNPKETIADSVPEYRSGNAFIRNLFLRRLSVAVELGDLNTQPLKVLDIGCGEGVFLLSAQQQFPQHAYFGWDLHPEVKKLKIPGTEFAQVDIRDIAAVQDQRFDRIFCLDVLEHFQDPLPALQGIRRLLKPSGIFVVSEPTESLIYRLGRLLTKGTFYHSREGPGAGFHYHNAKGIHGYILQAGFHALAVRKIPSWPVDLFHIRKYGIGQG